MAAGSRAVPDHRTDSERAGWLREAIALWHGQPLGGLPGDWAARTRETWRQHHLDASVAWGRAELRRGDPDAVIGAFTALADENPFEEPVAAVLLRALHSAGRSAGALERYATIRRRLGDDLGTEPGPELQQVHQAILCGDPDPVPRPATPAAVVRTRGVPAQLPADVGAFTGREREQLVLDAVVTRQAAGSSTSMPIVAISGTAGVGKTALAVHWGHRVAARFPDGQIYLDLRGYDPAEPVSAADALVRLLTAVGVSDRLIPPEVDERAARYRTEIAGRRMLIVLDNTSSVEQVRPLLPGSSSCMVIVTSRDTLAGLVALHSARRIELDLLSPEEATGLLRHLIGPRMDAEPAAARALTVLCARLPLALRIAAELVVGQLTRPLTALVRELSDEQTRLELLDSGDDPHAAVTAVFSWSVAKLQADAARTFGLLGLHPGPDLDLYGVAALTGGGLAETRRILARLVRAYLIQPTRAGRYGMHDLLRVYAASLVADSERAAVAAGDRHGEALALLGIGTALMQICRFGAAVERLTESAEMFRQQGDPIGEARALNTLGVAHRAWGRLAAAAPYHHAALRLFRRAGELSGEARAHSGAGRAHHALGNRLLARAHCTRALRIFHELDIRDTPQLGKLRAVIDGRD
ncbi:hypothetical protein DMB66_13655 [Actinoplanes sp. ATCC 53533]|uniref:BTAD domain-containing putative transcriptional regulator n=1 Tax=Actinoplanes sp. ATCC 53533 TaxID=1288362 RepID=UPI000F798771|nr:BTAD domain-containing putative transcriptional regulator [Actinoplanes sp. ATCC 53533]RSM68222.1 hypothetical protein DMB66_13655 [Actinoplanes sp. ATCC 53533]